MDPCLLPELATMRGKWVCCWDPRVKMVKKNDVLYLITKTISSIIWFLITSLRVPLVVFIKSTLIDTMRRCSDDPFIVSDWEEEKILWYNNHTAIFLCNVLYTNNNVNRLYILLDILTCVVWECLFYDGIIHKITFFNSNNNINHNKT